MRGKFIVFEGADGVGKTTQARILADRLGAHLTREPGATPLGLRLREILSDPNFEKTPEVEVLLMAADRSAHISDVIVPKVEAGTHVVSDRHVGSSFAYQGYGRGVLMESITTINMFATLSVTPDLVIYLDAPRHVEFECPDWFEQDEPLLERVTDGYRKLAKDLRWSRVDGDADIETVTGRVDAVVKSVLGL